MLTVLLAAAAYDGAVALGWIAVGPAPGQGPAGAGPVQAAALLALLVGAVVCATLAGRSSTRAGVLEQLLPLAGAAFVGARFYAYDPYYAPTLRRMSEQGAVSGTWVLALAGVALVAAALTGLRPRVGLAVSGLTLFLSAVTALWMGTGH